jgi:hypothetical protein
MTQVRCLVVRRGTLNVLGSTRAQRNTRCSHPERMAGGRVLERNRREDVNIGGEKRKRQEMMSPSRALPHKWTSVYMQLRSRGTPALRRQRGRRLRPRSEHCLASPSARAHHVACHLFILLQAAGLVSWTRVSRSGKATQRLVCVRPRGGGAASAPPHQATVPGRNIGVQGRWFVAVSEAGRILREAAPDRFFERPCAA